MPHFGLMDERKMERKDAALQRARLHIRGGRRRLRQGKYAAGIATLYDALSFAMRWYILSHEEDQGSRAGELDFEDTRAVFYFLVSRGVLEDSFDFDRFDSLVEKGLRDELFEFDWKDWLGRVEDVMRRLGVMPFDEASLPPEDPSTF